jgi:hypothetical protein
MAFVKFRLFYFSNNGRLKIGGEDNGILKTAGRKKKRRNNCAPTLVTGISPIP